MDEFSLLLALHAPQAPPSGNGRDLAAELRGMGFSVEISRNQADTWAAVRDRPPGAVLLVPATEQADSAELLSLLRPGSAGRLPPALVVLTDDPAFLEQRAGEVDDFVSPGETTEHILLRVSFAMARRRARHQLADERASLLRASSTDYKTGLPNDRRFAEICRIECARAVRENHWLGVLMIDLDDFKSINDDHDHEFGDHVLKTLADSLSAGLRPFDTAARKGGDEFAVLLPSADLESASTIAERLRASFADLELNHGEHSTRSSITVGVAAWHPEGDTLFEQVLLDADKALLVAKEAGRNRVSSQPVVPPPLPPSRSGTKAAEAAPVPKRAAPSKTTTKASAKKRTRKPKS